LIDRDGAKFFPPESAPGGGVIPVPSAFLRAFAPRFILLLCFLEIVHFLHVFDFIRVRPLSGAGRHALLRGRVTLSGRGLDLRCGGCFHREGVSALGTLDPFALRDRGREF